MFSLTFDPTPLYHPPVCRIVGPYQLRHSAFRLVQAEFGRDAARCFGGHTVGGATENYAGEDLMTAARVAAKWG